MPKLLENLKNKIQKKEGVPESNAYAIATNALQRQGKLAKGGQKLTGKGRAYAKKTGQLDENDPMSVMPRKGKK